MDQIEHMPNLDVPCLRRPRLGELSGPIDQYNRTRYLDMAALSHNLVLTKRLLEDEGNNWSKDGIPLAWKVRSHFYLLKLFVFGFNLIF